MNKMNECADAMRLDILRLAAEVGAEGKGAHIAPSLSIVEILTVLFQRIICPDDIFILSKGHAGLAYYVALKAAGIITEEQLNSFETDGGDFPGQPSKKLDNNIVFSSGSLGMGLTYACGLALASKKQGSDKKIYVLIGDGELNEGSNWESIMFARHQKLGNIVAIVDNNGMQSDGDSSEILSVNLESIFNSFDWNVRTCDGHSLGELEKAFDINDYNTPNVVLAKTVKGSGVSFMENNITWHHNLLKNRWYQAARKEVEDRGI